ncbi:MAG: SMC family ATPase [Chloroflexota bacterium]
MIPIKLTVRNFMCYRDQPETLNLTGIHLACLSGENGAGKSALLEAITWVLWGKARDRSIDDELISKGATEMEVDYQFVLNGDAYRVIRKRTQKGKSGTTMLDIQVSDDAESDNWRSLSGATQRESQEQINNLLKISYDTFINSAFLMQGRADEFTVKKPAERKQVLADILGLEQYDRLETEAKEEARERASRIGELKSTIERIDIELAPRGDYTERLGEIEDDLTLKQSALIERRVELADLQSHEQNLVHTRNRLREIAERIERREHNMDAIKTRIVRNDERRKSLEQLLERRSEIEAGWTEWQSHQERDAHLNDMRNSLDALDKERIRLDGALSNERIHLDLQIKRCMDNIKQYTQSLSGRGVLEQQLSEVLDKLSRLTLVQQQHEDTRCEKDALDVKLRTITSERNTLEKEGKLLRQKLDLLVEAHIQGGDHVGCPLCGTGLTEDALTRVRKSYESDIELKRRAFRDKDNELEAIRQSIIAVDKRYAREQEELRPLEMHRKREAELRHKQQTLDQDEQSLVQEESALVLLRTRLSDGDYGHETRTQLDAVRSNLATLDYDQETHTAVKKRLIELRSASYDSQHHSLQSAERDLPAVQQSMDEDNITLASMRAEQEADRADELLLTPQAVEFEEVQARRLAKQRETEALDAEVTALLGERGQLKSKLDRCETLQSEREMYSVKYATAAEERGIYDELSGAFGKKGIQAMIIESAIPDIEEETNKILHKMTDGRMSVQFQTQRDAKTGKGNVIETLDIDIADEVGTRAYEMYSGGEAFRVNFAVRIALSKLLARRAGTQLQSLVIDEGFGSQDGQGREKLVSAIHSIQDDFEKILVITHIEELKDEFPTRINIIKTGSGSHIMQDGDAA